MTREKFDDPHRRSGQDAGSLGEVLDPGGGKAVVAEAEWVALVRSIAAGDQRALHSLFERGHRIVYTLSFRITSNRETAEEVTLDVFHQVWRRAVSYDAASGTVLGWLMNQTRSRAIDRLRVDRALKRVGERPEGPRPGSAADEPGADLARIDQGRLLRDGLSLLTPGEREAIESAYFSGLSYAETATRLGQPIGTVKTRIRSGLAKLRRVLGDREEEL